MRPAAPPRPTRRRFRAVAYRPAVSIDLALYLAAGRSVGGCVVGGRLDAAVVPAGSPGWFWVAAVRRDLTVSGTTARPVRRERVYATLAALGVDVARAVWLAERDRPRTTNPFTEGR